MKVKVDRDLCIGCGTCPMIAEDVFEMKDGKSVVKEGMSDVPEELKESVRLAAQACPVGAIKVQDDE